MSRVERMFGPRENWGDGKELERVAARTASGQQQGGGAKIPKKAAGKNASALGHCSGIVPAKEARAAGFNKGKHPGISGFVSIRCDGCGKIHNTCLREKQTGYECRQCGTVTSLEKVANLHFKCPRCGFLGKYRTNRTEKELDFECLSCSEIVPMKKVRRGNYVLVGEVGEGRNAL